MASGVVAVGAGAAADGDVEGTPVSALDAGGGCALPHWDAAPYRAWKRELVAAHLRHAGVTASVADLVDAHGAGRRRPSPHKR